MVAVEDTIWARAGSGKPSRAATGALVTHLPAGQTQRTSYRGRFTERGRYRFGPLRLVTRFPFGLVRRSRSFGQPATITVCPRLGRMTAMWRSLVRRGPLGARRTRMAGVRGSEFHSLRDWRAGDSRRWIHWRTSARRGDLMVRQFEEERHDDLAILLDLCDDGVAGGIPRADVERVVRFAATSVDDACRYGTGRLTFAATGATGPDRHALFLAGAPSSALAQEITESLAAVEPSWEDQGRALLRRLFSETNPQTRVVILTASAARAGLWQRRLTQLDGRWSRRAASVTVLCAADPKIDEYFQEAP
jgi:uncharacterized protein (DUF58 family)